MRLPPLVLAALASSEALLLGGCQFPRGAEGSPVAAAARPGAPPPRATFTLPNGLAVVLQENHAAPVVAVQAWVAAGAADEPADLPGAAHFYEHLLRAGARDVQAAGGAVDAWTSFDETVLEAVLPASFLGTGLDAVARALARPAFAPPELEAERRAILDEIRQASDDPARVGAQALFAAAFEAHPYGRPVLGIEARAGAIAAEPLSAFFRRAGAAENVTLVVVGDFDGSAARAAIARAFAGIPRGAAPLARAPAPAARGPRAQVVVRDMRQPRLLLGFSIPALGHDDLPALDLLAALLGQGEGARLNLELVRNRQLAASVRAYTWSARGAGLMVVEATPAAGRLDEAERVLLDETLRLAREDVGPEEIERARTALEGEVAQGRSSLEGRARKLGLFGAVAGDAARADRYLPRLRALGAADLRAAAARYLRGAGLTVAAVVPAGDAARANARLLEVARAAEARADKRAAQAAPTAAAEDVARFVLPSGTRVLVLHDPTSPLVSIEALWPGGLRDEDARSNGVSALLGAVLARGTRTRSAAEIAAEVEAMAGSLSSFASRNGVGVRAELLAPYWERGFELLADCLRNPSFSDDEVERARRVLLDQLRSQDDDGGQAAFRLFAGTLWQKHPYRLDPRGSAEAISSLGRRRLVDHYRHHYPMSALTIAVVGDVAPAAVAAKLQALLGEAAGPPPAAPVVPEPARQAPDEVFRFLDRDQAHVVIGYPGVTLGDPDRFALALLAQILGGTGGRLPLELGDKRGLAFRASASSIEGIDPGAFAVYLSCSPARLEAAVQGARAELARVAATGVSPDEVARAARALVGAQAMSLRSRGALASALAAGEAYGQGFRAYRLYPREIGKVSAADVQRVARRVLDDKRQVVAVVKPPEPTPALGRAQAQGGGGRTPAP